MHPATLIDTVLPYIISYLELIGIVVITFGAGYSFYGCLRAAIKKSKTEYRLLLLDAMALGLEFKMAAEILKTVLIHTFEELFMLGAVILLRTVITLIIHFEMKFEQRAAKSE